VKHAGRAALETLEPLLRALRGRDLLREKSPGSFYLKSQAFLHFHEDPKGLFADLKRESEWERLPVNTARQRAVLLGRVDRVLARARRSR